MVFTGLAIQVLNKWKNQSISTETGDYKYSIDFQFETLLESSMEYQESVHLKRNEKNGL